jgi:hypothetical protein
MPEIFLAQVFYVSQINLKTVAITVESVFYSNISVHDKKLFQLLWSQKSRFLTPAIFVMYKALRVKLLKEI